MAVPTSFMDGTSFAADLERGRNSPGLNNGEYARPTRHSFSASEHSAASRNASRQTLRQTTHFSRPSRGQPSPVSFDQTTRVGSNSPTMRVGSHSPITHVGSHSPARKTGTGSSDDEPSWTSIRSPTMKSQTGSATRELHSAATLATPGPPRPSYPRRDSEASSSRQSINSYSRRTRALDLVEASKLSQQLSQTASEVSLPQPAPEKPQLPSTLAERVFEAASPDLLYDITEKQNFKDVTRGVFDITTLERMSIHVLQAKLVEQVKVMGDKRAWQDIGITETLHQYCEAVRDLEYMEERAKRGGGKDPFLISTSNPIQSRMLQEAGLIQERHNPRDNDGRGDMAQRFAVTTRDGWSKQLLKRMLIAFMGGLALIAPFLIMILVDGELARLITTCGFMVLFSVVIAFASDMSSDRASLVTGLYTAVLILFVSNDPRTYLYS